jgi:RNA polymerase sigma factor (sigma-70 family)
VIQKKEWELSQEALEKLLARFDPDFERAGETYEFVRNNLIKYFECRGCTSPSDLADKTINRVACKIDEGEAIEETHLFNYFYGVARNIYREQQRRPDRGTNDIESISRSELPSQDPRTGNTQQKIDLEQRLECLEDCLAKLPQENREMILAYYQEDMGASVRKRKEMAMRFGVQLNNLYIRVHRIRERLEKCVSDCLLSLSNRKEN